MHTWFYKNKELYEKELKIWEKLDNSDEGIEYIDELDYNVLYDEANNLDKENDAGYHDLFRTWKRESDGCYTLDVIYSKEECTKWLEDNKDLVKDIDKKELYKFWDEYPNGVIDFG